MALLKKREEKWHLCKAKAQTNAQNRSPTAKPKRRPRSHQKPPRVAVWRSCRGRHASQGEHPSASRPPPSPIPRKARPRPSPHQFSPIKPLSQASNQHQSPIASSRTEAIKPLASVNAWKPPPGVVSRTRTHATRLTSPATRAWQRRNGPPLAHQKLTKLSLLATCPCLYRKSAIFPHFLHTILPV